ncbi:MAG: hypothetical protein ACSHW1_00960 [Yoonia sp.]|uniref:hypothetical protein n=1 Tax=Yoonia sp. TaxID=2212373 RepID=UPI003EF9ED7D
MQMPFTLRLAYHSFRAGIQAVLIAVIAWLFLIPATPQERDTLGALPGAQYPDGLREMRTAQIIVAVGPPQIYGLIAWMAGPQVPAIAVRYAINEMAQGRFLPIQRDQQASDAQEPYSTRTIGGARFITPD